MNVFEYAQRDEDDPVYKKLETENGQRYYDFLNSIIESAVATKQLQLNHELIKALNYHAIVGLHPEAGTYRSVPIHVGPFTPPPHTEVQSLMDNLIDVLNRRIDYPHPVVLAAYALWGINYIHPFVNGNGRTARAVCYFLICTKLGGILPGKIILPELLRDRHRAGYVRALQAADAGDHQPLRELLQNLITEQVGAV